MATYTPQDSWADLDYAIHHKAVSFEQLAYIHLARRAEFEQRAEYRERATQYYPAVIAAFCKEHGTIVECYDRYWPGGRMGAIFAVVTSQDNVYVRYFKPDLCTIPIPISELLADVEALLARGLTKARTTLDIFPPGAVRREQLLGLFDIMYALLGLLDDLLNAAPLLSQPERLTTLAARYHALEKRFAALPREDALLATQEARFKFFEGMIKASGSLLVLLAAVTLILPAVLPDVTAKVFPAAAPVTLLPPDVLQYTLSCLAGGVGAVFSVLQRVQSGSFALEYRLGWRENRMLGGFRPLIGAIIALALVIFLKGGVLNFTGAGNPASPMLLWYISLAFLAGFSERFAHIVLGKAEGIVAPATEAGKETKPATSAAQPVTTPQTAH